MRTELTKSIGEEIKQCRENKLLSIENAANEAGVAPSTWSSWERGDGITIPRLELLAEMFEVQVCQFFPERTGYAAPILPDGVS